MKKLVVFAVLVSMLLTLSGCFIKAMDETTAPQFPTDESGNPLQPSDAKISPDQAIVIVQEAMGITDEQMLSPFVHIGTYGENNESCYDVMFATLDRDYEFIVSAVTGEIMYRDDQQ